MTPAFEDDISPAGRLPQVEQECIAQKNRGAIALIKDDALWQLKFDDSEDILEMLHDEALREYQAGRTKTIPA